MRRRLNLGVLLVILAALVAVSAVSARMQPTRYLSEQLEARNRLENCFAAVRGYKEELGIPISPLDTHQTGMIGDDFSDITTSLGAIEAKRTASDPDMAALLVRMFHEAGLNAGDTVGAGFSGSFPALNLAVICACDAMGLDLVYISSVGASTYGANQTELTFPDMAHRLYADGWISSDSTLVTPGGDRDLGLGTIEPEAFEPILARMESGGLTVLREGDYQKNLAVRRSIYEKAGIDCFAAVGGNITSMGIGDSALSLGQGLLRHNIRPDRLDAKSGLVEWYLANGLPVINLLNLKKICADYGMPFDPPVLAASGKAAVYHEIRYPVWPLVTAAAGTAAVLGVIAFARWQKKQRGKQTVR